MGIRQHENFQASLRVDCLVSEFSVQLVSCLTLGDRWFIEFGVGLCRCKQRLLAAWQSTCRQQGGQMLPSLHRSVSP